jgi:predicted metalloprotease
MRLDDERESSNVEDLRGSGGGGGGFGLGGRSVGIGTIVIALAASYFFGINPMSIIGHAPVAQQSAPRPGPPANDAQTVFVRRVLGSTERTWQQIFQADFHHDYPPPTLVLFTGGARTGCGYGESAMGPFYCPADRKVYIDLSFYREMRDRFGASGDFAQAYVIAHEVGHHVQNVLGISEKANRIRQHASPAVANRMSVRIELQADCFAGVWATNAEKLDAKLLEPGDIEEGLNAAGAIGDDRLQKQAQGRVVPESFTHGTSAQRQHWLRRGLETGDLRQCDTFSARDL